MGVQLSIVIPAYDARDYIVECVESVLAQKDAPEFEVIVVDDGSSDGTAELVERRFPTIRLLRKPNGGPGSARNLGVSEARGSVIIFIDADDIMLPGRLAFQGTYMLAHPEIGLTFGNQIYESNPDFDTNRSYYLAEGDAFAPFPHLHLRLVTGPNYVANTAVAVSRTAYIDVGGQPEDIIMQEDFAMHCAIARTWPVATSTRYFTWYRQSHSSHITADRGPFYHCFITARGRELRASRELLEPEQYEAGRRIWEDMAERFLAKVWIEQGRPAVLSALLEWQDLFAVRVEAKWRRLSRVPSSFGLAARQAVRLFRAAEKL